MRIFIKLVVIFALIAFVEIHSAEAFGKRLWAAVRGKAVDRLTFVHPRKDSNLVSGTDESFILYINNMDAVPEGTLTFGLYRDDTAQEDRLTDYVEFEKKDLIPLEDEEHHYRIPFDFKKSRVVTDHYEAALLKTGGTWGTKTLAVSQKFEVYAVGAQPGVVEELQFILDAPKPLRAAYPDCSKIPLSIVLGKALSHKLEIRLRSLSNDKLAEFFEIPSSKASTAKKLDFNVRLPMAEMKGPFVLEMYADRTISADKILWMSNAFTCGAFAPAA